MSTFVLNRNYELQLPDSFVDIDREEMEYVDGGSTALTMNLNYLNKNYCLNKAYELIRSYAVRNMTQLQIAQEIYAHAICYYGSPALMLCVNGLIGVSTVSFLRSHASIINIDDGLDPRAWAYSKVWNCI